MAMKNGMKFLPPEAYQNEIEVLFHKISLKLKEKFPYARIDHIGSSAINGAYSKGDLDILIRVPALKFEETRQSIELMNYQVKVGSLRTSSLCMLESLEHSDVAIQLIEQGSQYEFFITFRDELNKDPSLVKKYNDLKLSSTGLSPEDYRSKKSEFIEKVLKLGK